MILNGGRLDHRPQSNLSHEIGALNRPIIMKSVKKSIGHIIAVFAGVDIVAFFPSQGRRRGGAVVVARPDHGILRQFHQKTDGGAQSGAVAAGQVGAAAVAYEKRVSREEVAPGVQTDTSGGMAGGVNHVESDIP